MTFSSSFNQYSVLAWDLSDVSYAGTLWGKNPFPDSASGLSTYKLHGATLSIAASASPVLVAVTDNDNRFNDGDHSQDLVATTTLDGVTAHAGARFTPEYAYVIRPAGGTHADDITIYVAEFGSNHSVALVSNKPLDAGATYGFVKKLTDYPSVSYDHLVSLGSVSGVVFADTDQDGLRAADPSTNLIVNGSFEDTTGTTATGFGFTANGAIPGWTTVDPAGKIDLHNNNRDGIVATDGSNWLDLEGDGNNIRIGQDVPGLVDGDTYRVSFDVNDSPFKTASYGPHENLVKVYWNGALIDTIDPFNAHGDKKWDSLSYDVVAGSGDGSDRLEFEGTGQLDNVGASVDNVRMVPTTVEPIVPGVTVNLLDLAGNVVDTAITDANGAYTLTALPGQYTVEFIAPDGTKFTIKDANGGASPAIDSDADETDGQTDVITIVSGGNQVNLDAGLVPAPDGVVDGEETGENMGVGYDDSNAPTNGGGDLITPNADVIDGNGGNDTIDALDGDDTVDGGNDDDLISGNDGNDILYGNNGDDTVIGGAGDDQTWGDLPGAATGYDLLIGGAGADTAVGGADADTIVISSATDAIGDVVDGGSAGDDDDLLDLTGSGPVNYRNVVADSDGNGFDGIVDVLDPVDGSVIASVPFTNIERFLDDGPFAPTLTIAPATDTPTNGAGEPVTAEDGAPVQIVITRNGPTDQPLVVDLSSDDTSEATVPAQVTILAGQSSVTVDVTPADDPDVDGPQTAVITASAPGATSATQPVVINDDDVAPDGTVDGEDTPENMAPGYDDSNDPTDQGGDQITAGPDDIDGNGGADTIDGGAGNDTIDGGDEDDLIIGGAGADELNGNDDDDTIEISSASDAVGDVVDGGAGGTDNDTLDLRGAGPVRYVGLTTDSDGNGQDGTVEILEPVTGAVVATVPFTNIENFLDDGPFAPTLTIAPATDTPTNGAGEPVTAEDGAPVQIVITRNGPTDQPLVVDLSSDDTSEATVPAQVTILAGQSSVTVDVTPADDPDVDGPQTAIITASAPGATSATQPVVINDDDVAPDGTVDGEDTPENMAPGYDDSNDPTDQGGDQITAGPDDIDGNGGADTIDGGAGNDTIDGGDEDDLIIGGAGADELNGNDDDDTIEISSASDAAGDVVDGGAGGTDNDTLDLRGAGPVRYVGLTTDSDGNGQDGTVEILEPVTGAVVTTVPFTNIENFLDDGPFVPGPDGIVDGEETGEEMRINYNDADGPTNGGGDQITTGNDVIEGNGGDDTINASAGNDIVDGGDGDDEITGNGGSDTLSGGNDADTFLIDSAGDAVGDDIDGGSGGDDNDTLDLRGAGPVEYVNVTTDSDGNGSDGTVNIFDADTGALVASVPFTNIENFLDDGPLTTGPDGIVDGEETGEAMNIGYDDANSPTDNGGDLITDGDDIILGNGGNDTIRAGGGSDFIEGGDDNDLIFGQGGNDNIFGEDGNDRLFGGGGSDSVDGGAGKDVLIGGGGADVLSGGDDADKFRASSAGQADGDVVDGGAGGDDNDTLDLRGAGQIRIVSQVADSNGNGTDGVIEIVDAAGATRATVAYSEIERILSDGIFDPGTGGGDGVVDGEETGEVMGLGYDDADGATDGGGDQITNGDDVIDGNGGDDTINASAGNDDIGGGAGNDLITGNGGADTISGGRDADTIVIDNAADAVGDFIDGGSGGDDNDVLDLTGAGPVDYVGVTQDSDGNGFDGTVEILDPVTGAVVASVPFTNIENLLDDVRSPVAPTVSLMAPRQVS